MIKKNLKLLLVTSAVILLPMVVGIFLWDRLPTSMNIHWGVDGQPDGTAGRAFAVFFPSLLLLATHWICTLISARQLKDQTPKVQRLTLWICPMLSLIIHSMMYTVALGLDFNMHLVLFVPLGTLFAVIGNLMPKVRRNANLGIKTIWALADDENWYATHRFGGKVWMAGGLLIIALSCLPWDWVPIVIFIALFATALAPAVYSWNFYRKKKASGAEVPVYHSPYGKWVWGLIGVMLIFLGVLMFTGNIEYTFGDDALIIDADHWDAVSVSYDDIETIEYREEMVSGSREWGWGSARLLLGTFRNEEFGFYTRYTYGGRGSCIVLTVEGKTLVIAEENAEATRTLYEQILEKMG